MPFGVAEKRPMSIAWTAEMTTGAATLDAEHQRLVGRFNALLEAVCEKRETRAIERTLREAGDAAVRHFSRDEDCALRGECPALQQNGEARAEFLRILATFRGDFERTGASPDTAAALERELADWTSRYVPGPGASRLPCVTGARG
jgi:hemerythrin-like metal-binding protein